VWCDPVKLEPITELERIDGDAFVEDFVRPGRPLLIRGGISREWPAYDRWNYDYFKRTVGDTTIPVFDSQPESGVPAPDAYMKLSEYLDVITGGPSDLRIFSLNVYRFARPLCSDFSFPDQLQLRFLRQFPMIFFGGEGSITELHYDVDLANILLTQFHGKKRVLLFSPNQSTNLYRMPWMLKTMVDLSRPDCQKFPRLNDVQGLVGHMEHGDTLFIPSGWWHYMEYPEAGYALSLRARASSVGATLTGLYNLFVMMRIDAMMKRLLGPRWFGYKQRRAVAAAALPGAA
jgi:hypothetical protein